MQPYRAAEQQPAPDPPPTTYSYADEIDTDRKRVGLNTLKILMCLGTPLGLIPWRWLDQLDSTLFLVVILMLLLVAAVLAIRYAQGNSASDVEAYEERLLGAPMRRRGMKRHSRRKRHGHRTDSHSR